MARQIRNAGLDRPTVPVACRLDAAGAVSDLVQRDLRWSDRHRGRRRGPAGAQTRSVRRPPAGRALCGLELDADYVAGVLGPTQRIKNEDKVLTFNIGSIVVAGSVLDRRTQFRQGETLQAECGLIPPHKDMWVECNLHDVENRVVDHIGLFVSADAMRAIFYYNFGDCLLPGEYTIALRIGGEEVLRRPISILPRVKACLAN